MELIGLSLALCVQDICAQRTDVDRVKKIIANTRCYNMDEWSQIIKIYKRSYWARYGDRAEKIVRKLLMTGRIEQPRLLPGRRRVAPARGRMHWVLREEEIPWEK